jgi:uroporphyrinogen decarboxylase
MRQAGRYLEEYRAVRAAHDFLSLLSTPDLACEVTRQPIRRFGFDAAIIFSDILVPLVPMGMDLRFEEAVGPVIGNPLRSASDVDRLRGVDPVSDLGFVLDAIQQFVRAEPDVPLIGFAGAPFTLASYMIEGGSTREFIATKRFLYQEPRLARKLLQKLAWTVSQHLIAQIEAGAAAVQIFDSWAGQLSKEDYLRYALPYTVEIVELVRKTGVPVIVFAKGVHSCLSELSTSGADVLSVDWTIPLDSVAGTTEGRVAIQGNLDPAVLLARPETIERETQRVLSEARSLRGGHIFNLGHGIHRSTNPDHVQFLVDCVRRLGRQRAPAHPTDAAL